MAEVSRNGNTAAEGCETEQEHATLKELVKQLWHSSVPRLVPLVSLESLATYLVLPFLPGVEANYFASRIAGHWVECSNGRLLDPVEHSTCAHASSDSVSYSAFASLARSVLSFILAPLLGSLSDILGRKPMLLLSQLLVALPTIFLLVYSSYPASHFLPFPAFYACSALAGILQPVSIMLAFIADLVDARARSSSFGLFFSVWLFHIAIIPKAGSLLGQHTALYVASIAALLMVLYGCFVLQESLPSTKKRSISDLKLHCRSSRWQVHNELHVNPFTPLMTVLRKSALQRVLLATAFLCTASIGGLRQVERQFFQLVLDFSQADQSTYLMVAGAGGVVAQSIGLHYLLRHLGEKRALVVCLTASALEAFALGFARTKAMAFVSSLLGSLATCTFACLAAIKSLAASGDEQGTVQGALQGVKSLGYGIGPMMVGSLLFQKLTDGSWAENKPSFALFGAGIIGLGAIACAIVMPWPPGSFKRKDDEDSNDQALLEACEEEEELRRRR